MFCFVEFGAVVVARPARATVTNARRETPRAKQRPSKEAKAKKKSRKNQYASINSIAAYRGAVLLCVDAEALHRSPAIQFRTVLSSGHSVVPSMHSRISICCRSASPADSIDSHSVGDAFERRRRWLHRAHCDDEPREEKEIETEQLN